MIIYATCEASLTLQNVWIENGWEPCVSISFEEKWGTIEVSKYYILKDGNMDSRQEGEYNLQAGEKMTV